MGDIRNEPSMEEILASIKRIIAEDGAVAPSVPRPRRSSGTAGNPREPQEAEMPQPAASPIIDEIDEEEILELTETMEPAPEPDRATPAIEEEAPMPQAAAAPEQDDRAAAASDPALVSDSALAASRNALSSLSALIVKPEANGENTLDGLVRELLRPMLKEWLDARLPELVEQIVEREVGRITGRVV